MSERKPTFAGRYVRLVLAGLALGGLAAQFMRQSELLGFADDVFRLRVPIRPLAEPGLVAKIRDALSAHYGARVRVEVAVGDVGGGTVAAIALARQQADMAAARRSLEADPFVRTLIDDFNAAIVPESVRPLPGEGTTGETNA